MSKKFLLIFNFLLLVTSCNNVDSSTNNSTNASSSPTSSERFSSSNSVDTKSAIFNFLKQAGTKNNYSIDFTWKNKKYTDVHTDSYFYFNLNDYGYVNLPLASDETKTGLYQVLFNNGEKTQLGSLLLYTPDIGDTIIESSTQRDNSFTSFSNLNPSIFNKKNGAYNSEDSTVINIFSYALGLTDWNRNKAFSGVDIIDFSNDSLTFKLIQPSNVNPKLVLTSEELTGKIYNIGSSKEEKMEKFQSEFKLPSEIMKGDDTSSPLTVFESQTHLMTKTKIVLHTGDQNKEVSNSELKIDLEEGNFAIKQEENGNVVGENYVTNMETGELALEVLDATNKVIQEDVGFTIEDVTTPWNLNWSLKEFRKNSDDSYHYYGMNPNTLFSAFTQTNLENVQLLGVDAFVLDNKISKLVATSIRQTDDKGNAYYYTFETEVDYTTKPTFDKITPYERIEGKTDIIENALSMFKDDNYRIEVNDKSNLGTVNSTIYKTDNVYVSVSTNSNKLSATGYYYTNGTSQGFSISGDEIVPQGEEVKKTIKEIASEKFAISPNVFDIADDNSYAFIRNNVYKVGSYFVFSDSVEASGSNFKFNIDPDNYVFKSASASYNLMNFVKGEVSETFFYESLGETVEVPEQIMTLLKQLKPFKEPTSWQEENLELYNSLVSVFGKDLAEQVPYYYSSSLYGNWQYHATSTAVDIYNGKASQEDYDNYLDKLVENGFVKQENSDPNALDTYIKGDLAIRVSKLMGSYFSINISKVVK